MWSRAGLTLGAAGKTRVVLLVEDNPGDAELIRELLVDAAGPAQEVVHVSCLKDAEAPLRELAVDVVLLDLRLPDGNDIECVRTVRSYASEIPIVVLTGVVDDVNLAFSCIENGAQDYLSKQSANREGLWRAIGYAIARARESNERSRADALKILLAAIVESTTDAVLSTSTSGIITSWNRGAEQIFGFSALEAVGRPVAEVVRPIDAEDAAEQMRRVRRGAQGEPIDTGGQLVRLRRDGTPVTLSVVSSALQDAEGRIVGLAAIARDITESKRRDEELARRNDELIKRDAQMRALMARLNAIREQERTRVSREVHDELGQLLTGLKMDLRWVGRRLASDAPPPTLAIGARLVEAERLVDSTIAAVQRIALELRPSALDALGLPAAVRDEARRFERRAGVPVEVDVKTSRSPPNEVATELFRICQELLTNVARHAHASRVRIGLDETEENWVLRVEDDGVGMDEASQRDASSLGLLGMVERARSLGGSIELSAGAVRGTVARVQVPRSGAS